MVMELLGKHHVTTTSQKAAESVSTVYIGGGAVGCSTILCTGGVEQRDPSTRDLTVVPYLTRCADLPRCDYNTWRISRHSLSLWDAWTSQEPSHFCHTLRVIVVSEIDEV